MVKTPLKFDFDPTCHYGEIGHLQNCIIMHKLMVAILDFEKSLYLHLIFPFYKTKTPTYIHTVFRIPMNSPKNIAMY